MSSKQRAATPPKKASTPPPAGTEKKERSVSEMSDEDRAKVIENLMTKRLVISEEGLKTIANHKYVGGEYTPLDNFMNVNFWNPLIVCIPKFLAPNLVTVTGLVIQISGFAVVCFYCPDFQVSAPHWAYAYCAFTIFAYQTLDALDGKQARRTGSSSPLGQLFDHGCDSVATIFLGFITVMSLHLGFTVRCVTFYFCTLLPFWMCQWSEYHAHVLPTNIAGLIGVTEAQIMSCTIVFANAFDTTFWEKEVGFGSLPAWWCGRTTCPISLNDGMVVSQLLVAVFGTAQCFIAVLKHANSKGTAIIQTLPIWMLAFVGYAWCVMIPQAHPRLVLFAIGVSFSYMTCQMIVCAMSRTPYHTFQAILIPLPIIFVISKFQLLPRHDDVLLGAYVAICVYSMARWVRMAIQEISQYIGIHTFRLGPRAKVQ